MPEEKRKKTGGRAKGTPNKSTADIRALSQAFGPEALEKLVEWMRSNDPKASVSAANAILDRAYGKPPQALTGPDGGAIETRVILSFD